ncbi:hypothetical protein IMG5_116140 [Ichthyophthirius multifiliis]|uniref:Uncharacterized protein n=1 Tax=Ichthyophthirius multifiliis TaxID=5932 RepID=G0QUB6_ICHMU|nr:hypothetical protein IMG5_116140 [Ichthyophthirius multifiliis]EGR31188.1 hypothetical protein IMG5_116140 [Ichthyophthirius multifiliis]|eukprot:XP_004034674.1 hypothetical protein IMG5_116140 [Ichthyophthirius multifiliis]
MKLPFLAQNKIFFFLFDEQINIKLINSLFYYKFSEVLEFEMVNLDNKFIKNTMSFLSFKDSYVSYKTQKFNNIKGIRMDRIINAELLPNIKSNIIYLFYYIFYFLFLDQSIQLQFTYKFSSNFNTRKKDQIYSCKYQFDAIETNKNRIIWAFKEECKVFNIISEKFYILKQIKKKHNYDQQKQTFVQAITPIKVGDNIQIAINYYNLGGMIDLDSITWKEPIFQHIPKIPIDIDSSLIHLYDENRICEIEQIYSGWILYNYFHNNQKCRLDFFEPQLTLKETRCAGVDVITSKLIFQAKNPGVVSKSYENFGINIKVLDNKQEAICQARKLGLFQDLQNEIQLRIGDYFIFYISKGE